LAEAGTGTGKTIGYLSTILAFLEKNPKQQVLISTYSKALQKQIYNDLVFLSTKTDLKVPKFADIKGSNN
jgi:ATP-dependent DNA helicase DinG